jgi:hypothetical protein
MNFCALLEEKLALSCAFDCSCASEIVWSIARLLGRLTTPSCTDDNNDRKLLDGVIDNISHLVSW